MRALGREGRRTLGKDEVVGLDEVIKGVLGQLGDVGSAGNCRGSEQAESDSSCGLHCEWDI